MRKTILFSVVLFSLAILGSCKKEDAVDTSKNLAVVETGTISNISFNSALIECTVKSEGASTVTKKGVVFGKTNNPVYSETPPNFVDNGTGVGLYTSAITNLETQTTYYVRAYATNADGVSYGVCKSFKTN